MKRRTGLCSINKKSELISDFAFILSGYQDSNLGPLGPKPSALPDCATPRTIIQTSFFNMAVREGFEPSVPFYQYDSLANY